MIEIRNLNLPLSGGRAFGCAYDEARLRAAVARRLGVPERSLDTCLVARRGIDARKRGDVHFVATVRASLAVPPERLEAEERSLCARIGSGDVALVGKTPYVPPRYLRGEYAGSRPVVVGAGAAGLFAALALAEAGVAPIVIERGAPAHERVRDVARFVATGELDPESNIQFGAGGAGTFSDGKLTTGTNVPENAWVLKTFVEAGASPDILWQSHPHIGSDVLPGVVSNLVARIERAGGEVRWRTRMTELVVEGGRLAGVRVESRLPAGAADSADAPVEGTATFSEVSYEIPCREAVLACGHSARDVLRMLAERGFTLEPKTFSMGVRIEHPQRLVDEALYGREAGNPALGAASYKLSCHMPDGRGVYTFCMCPGGTVVAAASEAGGVVTNGMSEFARDGANANAALLANVYPADIPGIDADPLAGVALQERCERRAFELGGGSHVAPAQLLGDFMADARSSAGGSVAPTYPCGVAWGSVVEALPAYAVEALRAGFPQLARRLRGFDLRDAVLTGVETRTSCPVRVKRGSTCESVDVEGLFPCGEGAGYAGGIVSAAADGLRCAEVMVERLNETRR